MAVFQTARDLRQTTIGPLHSILNDRSGSVADVQQAAKLARAQGNAEVLRFALGNLRAWGSLNSQQPQRSAPSEIT